MMSWLKSIKKTPGRPATRLLFLGLILIGGLLRLVGLTESPPSLNWDEVALGYNAYSLSITGRDEYGQLLPLSLRSFDDYKPALSAYLMIPSVKLLGLNPVSVRLPFALLGIGSLILIFLIAKEIFKNESIALLALLGAVFSPWHLQISRVAYEAGVSLFFFLLGFWGFLVGLRKGRFWLLTAFGFAAALYAYHSARLLLPVLLTALVFLNWSKIKSQKREALAALILGIFLCLPLVRIFLSLSGKARFATVNIVFSFWPKSPLLSSILDQGLRLKDWLLLNPVYFYVWEILGRYFSYFSPANLFARGDPQPGHTTPGAGMIYWLLAPFWLSGLILAVKKKKLTSLYAWLGVAPLAAAITYEWFHLLRALIIFPAYVLLIGFGLHHLFLTLKKKISHRFWRFLVLAFAGLYLFNIVYFLDSYFFYVPRARFGDWQHGFEQAVPFVASIQENYDQVVIQSPHAQPYIFFLFYQEYPPAKYQKEVPLMPDPQAPRKVFDFYKYQFRDIYWPKDRYLKRTLFVGTELSLPEKDIDPQENARIIKNFYDPAGYVVFRIAETD